MGRSLPVIGFFETTPCAGWRETGPKSSMERFLIYIDAQDLTLYVDFALFPGVHEPPRDHRQSQLPVKRRLILSILSIDVRQYRQPV